MLNITITGVKGYSYTGYILANELSPEQRKVLNIPDYNQFYENDYEVQVEGDFVLEWDDGSWAADKYASQIDAAYDRLMDR